MSGPTRHSFGRGLGVLAALLVACPSVAAPAKRHKPKPAAAKAAESPPSAPDDAAPDPPKPDDEPSEAKPSPLPPAEPEHASSARDKTELEPQARSGSAESASAPPSPEPDRRANDQEREALGVREMERIAAGRVEVAVSASVGVGSRHFKYSDPLGRLLAPYRLAIAPMASFGLEAYPLASSNIPGLRDFGFRGYVSRAFAVNSKTPDGSLIDTSWTRFGGELRQRFLVPGPHAFELGIDAGADASYFVLSTTSKVAALLPSARSISLRFGFDTRLLVSGRFSLLLGGAYLVTTSPGEIYDRFRKPHVAGVDGDFGCALGLVPGLEARLNGRYTRYFSTFHPHVGDAAVAGGALDEQWQIGLGARYAH